MFLSFLSCTHTHQLIFSDILSNRLYITQDEGETYMHTNVTIPFTPNRILFQSTLAPKSDVSPQYKYVLGYDSEAQSVSSLIQGTLFFLEHSLYC